jgi:aminoglycoside phosphotransferase (APT) family kinase protein
VRFDAKARDWIERSLGGNTKVASAKRMYGGLSSIIHAVVVERDGQRDTVVLRRIEPRPDGIDEPEMEIAGEQRSLQVLRGRAFAPTLLACDVDGSQVGYSASLQTRLPGRPTPSPLSVDRWVRGLAEATRAIRDADVPAEGFDSFVPWWPEDRLTPAWSVAPDRWSEAAERLRESPPVGGSTGLVHRDLHPGNVLFHRGTVSGVVDWVHACKGPVEVDISRCRVQIALLVGMEAADAYLHYCDDLTRTYDPRWDALVAIELSPWVQDIVECYEELGAHLSITQVRATLDHFVLNS